MRRQLDVVAAHSERRILRREQETGSTVWRHHPLPLPRDTQTLPSAPSSLSSRSPPRRCDKPQTLTRASMGATKPARAMTSSTYVHDGHATAAATSAASLAPGVAGPTGAAATGATVPSAELAPVAGLTLPPQVDTAVSSASRTLGAAAAMTARPAIDEHASVASTTVLLNTAVARVSPNPQSTTSPDSRHEASTAR